MDLNFDIRADTPMDATGKALRQNSNLAISSVIRTSKIRAR